CLFPKGAQYAAEIKEAQALARFDIEEKVSVTDSAARILLLRNIVFI
ncbi:MAG: 16S rRNA (guanine(527)-N(7))-methyltransferase RsmG, partial [Micavibrio aeruginosavorus]|nr:16S rRNA (guanine(527)-N(7))-methyltransferase RsmG [Micavibrio aeruginosavorus]